MTRTLRPRLRSAQPADFTAMPGLVRASSAEAPPAELLRSASVRPAETKGIRFMPPSTLRYAGRSVPAAIRSDTLGPAFEVAGCPMMANPTAATTAAAP
ncbi:MAG: hypothetical protein ACR2JO_01140 [Mycobacteriales bacterium]